MHRTRSNLTLAALLLAVGYIVGQAVGPRGADAGVSNRPPGEQVVTVPHDDAYTVVLWSFPSGDQPRATSYKLTTTLQGQHTIEAIQYTRPQTASRGR